ncbi:MerR family transcriptional regulator [Nakamurella silvestris]|nr:MerR family transcriptional regulator [Nakamurella silvestris]
MTESEVPWADSAEPERLTIGAFARRSWLSPKALRLYDGLGLLSPAEVDQHNGYRWYHASQLPTARLIAMLRRLDMPLDQVAVTLAAPAADQADVVAAYWESVERRHSGRRELARYLGSELSRNWEWLDMYTISERQVPEQTVLTEQRHVTADALPTYIYEAMTRLLTAAEKFGGPSDSPFVVYHGEVNQESDGPVEVCIPVAGAEAFADPTRVEPAHRVAYTRITKAQVEFPQILSAYTAVEQWIRANDRTVAGSPREVYFTDFGAAAPEDEVCDIAFPVG